MIKKLLPLIMLLVGVGAGVGAGIVLKPAPAEHDEAAVDAEHAPAEEHPEDEASDHEYLKMSNQFIVPIVKKDLVRAMVVLSLSLEITTGEKETVYAREPKLRDSFLRILFDHANIGGFDGAFTDPENLDLLRTALREVAQKDIGDTVNDVLIIEIARQDM